MRGNNFQAQIRTYLSLTTLPIMVQRQLEQLILKWIRCSGVEWTCGRIKTLTAWRIRSSIDPTYTEEYFHNDEGKPKGPFKFLWRISVHHALEVLRISSLFTLQEPSKLQLEKFYSGVENTTDKKINPYEFGDDAGMTMVISEVGKKLPYRDFHQPSFQKTMEGMTSSSTRRAPIFDKKGQLRTDVENHIPPSGHSGFVYQNATCYKLTKQLIAQDEVIEEGYANYAVSSSRVEFSNFLSTNDISSVWKKKTTISGRISYIQERGCKLRAIANPGRGFQGLLEPMKQLLLDYLRVIPSDYTHDQQAGAKRVQLALQDGRHVTCLDLSDATSTFPVDMTLGFLRKLLRGQDSSWETSIALFEEVSKGIWVTPEGKQVRFAQGQPLGLGPSFAAFALSHHAVMFEVLHSIKLRNLKAQGMVLEKSSYLSSLPTMKELNNSYAMVGDDICIFDDSVAFIYKMTMEQLGCKFSEKKEIPSNQKYAEFVGFWITPDTIQPLPKWVQPDDNNFMAFLKTFGPEALKVLPKHIQEVASIIVPLPEPVGLGWNPNGLPLSQRIAGFEDMYLKGECLFLADDARDSAVLPADKIALQRGLHISARPFVDTLGDQPKDPSLKLLWNLAKVGLPINGNLNQIQVDFPEKFSVRVINTQDLFYHKVWLGPQISYSNSKDVRENNQFLRARTKIGMRNRPISLLRVYRKAIKASQSSN